MLFCECQRKRKVRHKNACFFSLEAPRIGIFAFVDIAKSKKVKVNEKENEADLSTSFSLLTA
jgi:hypothetical protein